MQLAICDVSDLDPLAYCTDQDCYHFHCIWWGKHPVYKVISTSLLQDGHCSVSKIVNLWQLIFENKKV